MLVLMYELKKIGKVFTSKSVGTGPSSYEKRIYRAAVSQRLRNTALHDSVAFFLSKSWSCRSCWGAIKPVVKSTVFVRVPEANLKSWYRSASEVQYRCAIMSAINEPRDFFFVSLKIDDDPSCLIVLKCTFHVHVVFWDVLCGLL